MNNENTSKKPKSKWKKRLIITLVVLAIIAVIGYVAYRYVMNYLGDKMMDAMIKPEIESMLDSGEITVEELEAIASGIEPAPPAPTEDQGEAIPSGEGAEKPSGEENEEDTASQAAKPETQTPSSKPASKPSTQPASTPSSQEVSPEKRAEVVQKATDKVVESIPRDDKDEILHLIRSRLSSADVTYLAGLLKGGLTGEEISAAARLAYSRFTPEEITRVKTYWHRYKGQIKRA